MSGHVVRQFMRRDRFGLVLVCIVGVGFAIQLHRLVAKSLFEDQIRAGLT